MWLYPFAFSLAIKEIFSYCAFSPEFGGVTVLDFGYFNRYAVVFKLCGVTKPFKI
jgi:hypothetical protein